jgi:putative transcriptional regulator
MRSTIWQKGLSMKKRESETRKKESVGASIIRGMEEALAHHRGEIKLRTTTYTVPGPIDVRAVRERLGLSQNQFAARYGFSPRTLQQWEQGRSKPDSVARAYLTVIDHDPKTVEKALKRAS